MSSTQIAAAGESLRTTIATLRSAAADAHHAMGGIAAAVDELDHVWSGPEPRACTERAAGVVTSLAAWPSALDEAADAVDRWAADADELAGEARRAERRLADAHDTVAAERDVAVRAARSWLDEIVAAWAWRCHLHADRLGVSIAVLRDVADRSARPERRRDRATSIARVVDALGNDVDWVDPTGAIASTLDRMVDEVMTSDVGPLAFTILETARDRDLFTADGHLSADDLDAADVSWTHEAVRAWQQATGVELDSDASAAVADLVATIATFLRVGTGRDWADDGTFGVEPALAAVLADSAVASFTRPPRVLADRPAGADAVAAFVDAGGGDIDTLPAHPTASEWAYHLHGPPHIPESFDQSAVFRTLLFDWEQVWGDDRSAVGGTIELLGLVPVGKLGRVGRVARHLDERDELIDTRGILGGGLISHEGVGGGHAIREHVGKSVDELRERVARENLAHASSFADLAEAERAIARALHWKSEEIATWLASGKRGTKRFDLLLGVPIGTVVGRDGVVAPGRTVRVVLREDENFAAGFRIQTAFVQ